MTSDKNMRSLLIKSLGMEEASEEKQNEVIESLGVVIYQAVVTRALEEMNDGQLDEFEKISAGEPTPEILVEFFLQKIPNFEQMMKEEAKTIVDDAQNIM